MIHLLIFIFLSILLTSFPFISTTKQKHNGFLTNFQSLRQINFFKLQKVVPNLIFLMNQFDYMIQSNIRVWFLWTGGFISWIFGCCFWVLQADIASLTFITTSIIFCLLAIVTISKRNIIEASNRKRVNLRLSVYVLIISMSVVTMVAFKSFAAGITMITLLLLFFYDWRVIKKKVKV